MTSYKHSVSCFTTPSGVNETKAKRKQQLDAVWERRKRIYTAYRKRQRAAQQRQQQS